MQVESHKNKGSKQPWRYKLSQKQVARLEVSCNIKGCGNPKKRSKTVEKEIAILEYTTA